MFGFGKRNKKVQRAKQDKRAIVFLAWGEKAMAAIHRCLTQSIPFEYPIYLITDKHTDSSVLPDGINVVITEFTIAGNRRKNALIRDLPPGLETVLFLDVDTIVLDDISLGFDMAEKWGIAMAPAPHYSLGHFRNFAVIMEKEGVNPRGQIIWNSGVVFLSLKHPKVRPIFNQALHLAEKYIGTAFGDQPFLSLAMEMLDFHPYALSPSFNHRAFGEIVSGSVHIWHSYSDVPDDAANLEYGYLHRYQNGAFVRALKVPE